MGQRGGRCHGTGDCNLAAALVEAAEGDQSRVIKGCTWTYHDYSTPEHGARTRVNAEAAAQARGNPFAGAAACAAASALTRVRVPCSVAL